MTVRKNTIANLAGSVLPMVVSLVTVPIYLKLVGAERYGVLAIIWVLLGYFGFFDFGFGRAVAQKIAKMNNANDGARSDVLWTAISTTFWLGMIAGAMLWLFSDYLLSHIIPMSERSRAEASTAVYWMLFALPWLLPASAMQGALQGRQRFLELNTIMALGSVLAQILPLAVASLGYIELESLVPSALVARLFSVVLLLIQCRKYVPLVGKPLINVGHLRPMMAYGGWISILNILSPILVSVDRLVISSVSGPKAVAYYSVPFNLVSRLTVIPGSLAGALFPRFAQADEAGGRVLAERASDQLSAILSPLVIVGMALIHPFLRLWVGEEFSSSGAGVAEILLFGVWINSLAFPHHSRLLAAGNARGVVIVYLVEMPLYFLALWVGLRFYGLAGAAAAWSLRVSFDTFILMSMSKSLLSVFRKVRNNLLLLLISVAIFVLLDYGNVSRWVFALSAFLISLRFGWVHIKNMLRGLFGSADQSAGFKL